MLKYLGASRHAGGNSMPKFHQKSKPATGAMHPHALKPRHPVTPPIVQNPTNTTISARVSPNNLAFLLENATYTKSFWRPCWKFDPFSRRFSKNLGGLAGKTIIIHRPNPRLRTPTQTHHATMSLPKTSPPPAPPRQTIPAPQNSRPRSPFRPHPDTLLASHNPYEDAQWRMTC
jgi:hypothetical protein